MYQDLEIHVEKVKRPWTDLISTQHSAGEIRGATLDFIADPRCPRQPTTMMPTD